MQQGQLEFGMSRSQLLERVWQQMLGCAGECADAKGPQLTGGLANREFSEVCVGEQPFGPAGQYLAGRGGPDAAGASYEQLAPGRPSASPGQS
jgi:hypothetical protein